MAKLRLRRRRKNGKIVVPKKSGTIGMPCSECDRLVDGISADSSSVICAYCVQKMILPPTIKKAKKAGVKGKRGRPRIHPVKPKRESTGWGRGWHLKKKFVAPDGRVFSRGKLVKKGVTK